MMEQSVSFGPMRGMHGVVSVPATPVSSRKRAVVMSNVGMHHRVGPFRLYVELARAMAHDGLWALRFDHFGMGESAPRPALPTGSSNETHDLAAAIDFLRDAYGIEEVLVVALCSGVDAAHPTSVCDPRIRGAVFIDGYTYPTFGFWLRRHVLRGFQLGRWNRFLSRKLRELVVPPPRKNRTDSIFDRTYPSREQFRSDIEALAARDVSMYFISTGTVDSAFNAERQLFEMLGNRVRRDRIAISRLQQTDHVFTSADSRRDLVQRIREWVRGVAP